MDHFILGGGVGQLPKTNSCTTKVEKKKSCKASSLTHSQAKGEKKLLHKLKTEKKFELRKIAQPQANACLYILYCNLKTRRALVNMLE